MMHSGAYEKYRSGTPPLPTSTDSIRTAGGHADLFQYLLGSLREEYVLGTRDGASPAQQTEAATWQVTLAVRAQGAGRRSRRRD